MKPLVFMGQQFADAAALRQAFPAFSGDDALRAIRNGKTTPMEVEVFCWEQKNQGYLKRRAAAQAQRKQFRKGLSRLAKAPKRRKAA